MNKSLFSVPLFLEGMRKNKTIGMVLTFIGMLGSFLAAFSYHFNHYTVYYTSVSPMPEYSVSQERFYAVNPLIYVVMVVAPFFVISVFGFMNHRKNSDFYHSLAYTRTCLYLSLLGSCICWELIIILGCTVTTLVTAALLPELAIIKGTTLLPVLTAIVCALLVSAVTAFAMTLTGTVFTNLLATLMILFAPRLFILFFYITLTDSIPYVISNESGLLFNYYLNGVIGIVFGALVDDPINAIKSVKTVVYTLVLALIYAGFGLLLFIRRRSEDAEKASNNSAIQCFFRLIPTLFVCLIPITIMFSNWVLSQRDPEYGYYSGDQFLVVVLFICAALVYFLYELITTRKLKNLVKAIPTFLIVPVICVISWFGLTTGYKNLANECPKPEEVDYVMITQNTGMLWNSISEQKIENPEIINLMCSGLSQTISSYHGYYDYMDSTSYFVTFKYNGKTIRRRVGLEEKDRNKLISMLTKENVISDALESLDQQIKECVYGFNPDLQISVYGIASDEVTLNQIYRVFAEEYLALSPEEKLELLKFGKSSYYYGDDAPFQISFYSRKDGDLAVSIAKELPKTLQACILAVNSPENGIDEFIYSVKNFAHIKDLTYGYSPVSSISLEVYRPKQNGTGDEGYACYNYYADCYIDYNGNGITRPDDDSLEFMSELSEMIKERQMECTAQNLADGAVVLKVNYYTYGDRMPEAVYDSEVTWCSVANKEIYNCFLVDEKTADFVEKMNNYMFYTTELQ